MLTCNTSTRLAQIANAFQRVRWNSIRFTIEGAYPSTSGGGYVVCFVRDANDSPPSSLPEALKWAMAQQHCADAKWYDSVALSVGRSPDLLYTSAGGGVRFESPGSLFVIAKGGPNQVGSLTITMHWDVTLSEPCIDRPDAGQWITDVDLYGPPLAVKYDGTSASSTIIQLGSQSLDAGVYDPDPANIKFEPYLEHGLPSRQPGTYYRCNTPASVSGVYNDGEGNSTIHLTGFVVDESRLYAAYEINQDGRPRVALACVGGTPPPIGLGYLGSAWHQITCGPGALFEKGATFTVFDDATSYSDKAAAIAPTRTFGERRRMVTAAPEPMDTSEPVAQTALTGELSRNWLTPSHLVSMFSSRRR